MRGAKIDHPVSEHDDLANAAAGAVSLCKDQYPIDLSDAEFFSNDEDMGDMGFNSCAPANESEAPWMK